MTRAPLNWWIAWTLLVGIIVFFYPPFANAIGDDVALGSFSCSAGVANGQLYLPGDTCPTTLSFNNVFSFLVCNMQQLSSNILGHMYCGLIYELTPAVWAAITLAVLIFGISFTIGLVAATGKEAIIFLLKIAFVGTFATNADYLIGYAYQFFISGMSDGVAIILSGMNVTDATTGAEAFQQMDGIIGKVFDYAIGGNGAAMGEDSCKNALFAVLGTLGLAFPIALYFGLALIARIVFSLFRAMFAYIYALFGITFLIIMAPFFVCFYLFKSTESYFNKWLGYMTSFTIQVVLLFAFLLFILSLPVSKITDDITNLIMYQSEAVETTAARFPWRYCTLCDFDVVSKDDPSVKLTDKDSDFLTKSTLQCKMPKKPITLTFSMSPREADGQIGALLSLLGNGILTLIVLAIVIDRLLILIPQIAQRLGGGLGASYAPQLGGGDGGVTIPGESIAVGIGKEFKEGMRKNAYIWDDPSKPNKDGGGSRTSLQGGVNNVIDSVRGMVGQPPASGSKEDKPPKDPTLSRKTTPRAKIADWRNWFSDPRDLFK